MAALALVGAGAAALYLYAVGRVRRWPVVRALAFLAGLAVLVGQAALVGDADRSLWAHMLEHLLITLVAPPLLVLGAPVRLALRALPARVRAGPAAMLRRRPLRALLAPVPAAGVFVTIMAVSHIPALYDAALRSPALHALQHGLYFWSAIAFWAVVLDVGPLPRRLSPLTRVLVVLATMPPMALVGVTIASAQNVLYDHYTKRADALADQERAGTLMWLAGTLPLGALALAIGWRALRLEDQRQTARERRLEARPGGGS